MTYEIKMAKNMAEKKVLYKELLENLRQIDKEEMEGLGVTSAEGVRRSIYHTTPVHYARNTDNGKLILCYGLNIYIGRQKNTHIIWALATDELKKVPKSFVKESAAVLRRWVDMYGELTNAVGTFNRDSIRWLKRLGAEFDAPFLIGEKEYVNFYLRKKEAK